MAYLVLIHQGLRNSHKFFIHFRLVVSLQLALYISPHSASCNVCPSVCVHISKCASAPKKIPPAQVAVGNDHHECKWSISAR